MADLQGRKVFKVFNQDFIVDERYTVTKELGQGAYGIVWYARFHGLFACLPVARSTDTTWTEQCRREQPDERGCCHQESDQCIQQKDPRQARPA